VSVLLTKKIYMSLLENIVGLVDSSDYSQTQKNIMKGFVLRAEDKESNSSSDRELIQKISINEKVSEVLLSNDDVKIYTIQGRDDFDIKYPYRIIFINSDGNWERCITASPNLDVVFLVYLQVKHLGHNSQFSDFSMKMLGIKIED